MDKVKLEVNPRTEAVVRDLKKDWGTSMMYPQACHFERSEV